MVHPVQLAFKYSVVCIASIALFAQPVHKQTTLVALTCKGLSYSNSILYYNGKPFTGTLYALYNTHDTALTEQMVNGVPGGLLKKWYPNGCIAQTGNYNQSRRTGTHYSWWPNGNIKRETSYVDDVMNGTAREWYSNGSLYREMNYAMGYETGMQRMWNIKGVMIVNYEMKEGRKYGLTGLRRCANPANDDERILTAKK